MPETLELESVKQLELNKIRNDVDKLFEAASNLQYTILEGRRNPLPESSQRTDLAAEAISSTKIRRRPTNRHWILADHEYPEDSQSSWRCCGNAMSDVLHFNPKTQVLELIPLNDLRGRTAVFSRMPSWFARNLYVSLERISLVPSGELPRCRVSSSRQVPGDMRLREVIVLKKLSMAAWMKVQLGRVKWVFITNLPGFEDPSGKEIDMEQDTKGARFPPMNVIAE